MYNDHDDDDRHHEATNPASCKIHVATSCGSGKLRAYRDYSKATWHRQERFEVLLMLSLPLPSLKGRGRGGRAHPRNPTQCTQRRSNRSRVVGWIANLVYCGLNRAWWAKLVYSDLTPERWTRKWAVGLHFQVTSQSRVTTKETVKVTQCGKCWWLWDVVGNTIVDFGNG